MERLLHMTDLDTPGPKGYAAMLAKQGQKNAMDLADVFCAEARKRIEFNFTNLFTDSDDKAYKVVQNLMKGDYDWLQGNLVEESAEAMPTPEAVEAAISKLR